MIPTSTERSAEFEADLDDPFGPNEVQCPIRELLSRTGARWSLDVIVSLSKRTRHFADLERNIPGITRRMLTLTLRGMERDGLVARNGNSRSGERVYYALTDLGQELSEHMRELAGWSQRNRLKIYEAREIYDRRLKRGLSTDGRLANR